MTYWNHRVIEVNGDEFDDSKHLMICEVWYDDDGTPIARSQNYLSIYGESVELIKNDLELMLACLSKPVLTDADIDYERNFK